MAQETKTAKDFKIEIKELKEFHFVYYEFTGPYQNCFNDFEKLMVYIQKNNIPMGPYSCGVFYDDPEEVAPEKLRSEPGFMVQGPVEVSDGYKCKKIPSCKVVSTKYKSMEELYPAYEAIAKYLNDNEIETESYSMEIYHSSDPNVVDAEINFIIK